MLPGVSTSDGQSVPQVWDVQISPTPEHSVDQLMIEVDQLRTALASRTTTAQATGLLAARFNLPIEQAWSVLRETSNLSNRKLADIARIVVNTHDDVPITAEQDIRVAVALVHVLDASVARVTARRLHRDCESAPTTD